MSRKGCGAAPAILVGAQILGLLRSPFAAQDRSYTDRVDGIDMGMGEFCGRFYGERQIFNRKTLSPFSNFRPRSNAREKILKRWAIRRS